MGDKSPKSRQKNQNQKKSKSDAANKKNAGKQQAGLASSKKK
jgi:hypothetical protein